MDMINWSNVFFDENDQKLTLFDQQFTRIPDAIINLYQNRVRSLTIESKLESLLGLSFFPFLEELVLDNNNLTDSIGFPKQLCALRILSLNKNKFTNLDLLLAKLAICFPNLEFLSLLGNKACPHPLSNVANSESDYHSYRLTVINNLANIKFLDYRPVTGCEKRHQFILEESENPVTSPFIVDLQALVRERFRWFQNDTNTYGPLPVSFREAGDHRSALGRTPYRYVGDHSEGNRFIANNDL